MVKFSNSSLDQIFGALSDSTRRNILERLADEGELMVTALAEPYEMSLPAVSKHLRVLERAGLLIQEKDGRIRRCQIVPEPLQTASVWIDQYRHYWESQLESLADHLDRIQDQDSPRQK
jgi:DNA-binding transcriptional ArsR family regulator